MQISKLKLGLCAVVLGWSISGVQAADDDTPEQAAARAALEKRMQADDSTNTGVVFITNAPAPSSSPMTPDESNAIQNATAKANADKAAADQAEADKQAAKAKAKADAQALDAAAATVVSMDEDTTPAQARALAELRKRMQEADSRGLTMTNGAAIPPMSPMATTYPPKVADQQAAVAPPAQSPAAPMPGVYPYSTKMGFKPVPVVPAPITPEKQVKLDNLLIQYQANQISPEAYHKERAAILDEP